MTTTHGNAGKKWTPTQRAKFLATLKKQKRDGVGFYAPERLAKSNATKKKKARAAKQSHATNGSGNGVDMDAGTPHAAGDAEAGGQHFPLDMIPDKMPPMPTSRARKYKANGEREFPNNAEGARLAVAMELLRTVNRLLRPDDG